MEISLYEELIQRQLEAYNAKDIDALLATYSPDAQHFEIHGNLLASGHHELRKRFLLRFEEPDLYATLLQRVIAGNFVVDHEIVTRTFPEGKGSIEMLCIYEIADGLIQRASFKMSNKMLDAETNAEEMINDSR